jgi:uncharacterized membrane protein (DUF2068 family)
VRLWPRHWNVETLVCSMRGHVTPAATVERLRSDDRELGFDLDNGRRYSRCLRCDAWTEGVPPAPPQVTSEIVPALGQLELPRRGQPLHDAVILRLIAIDRGVHAVVFGARDAADRLDGVASNTGPHASHDALSRELHRIAELRQGTITILAITATAYCIIEGIEAVGLWKERRWAEYLTVVATAGFLPFEVRELVDRVSVFRVGALVVNVAILAYLVWNKRLFGVRGGAHALHEQIDWPSVLAPPTSSEPAPPHPTPTR